MGTAVVLVVLAGIVAIIIRSMVRDKKAGKALQRKALGKGRTAPRC